MKITHSFQTEVIFTDYSSKLTTGFARVTGKAYIESADINDYASGEMDDDSMFDYDVEKVYVRHIATGLESDCTAAYFIDIASGLGFSDKIKDEVLKSLPAVFANDIFPESRI